MPEEAAVWREDGFTRSEEFAALAIERADRWRKALWEITARRYIESPPKKLEHPGVLEITRPGEQPATQAAEKPNPEKPEKDRYQKSRERAAFFGSP